MNLTKKISWDNTHIYFFYLFLFSIPFQTRKVFLTEYSFYSGAFTEYATFFVYVSDILLILTLIFWLVFNKKLYKYLDIKNLKNARKLPTVFLLLIAFIVWLIISAIVNNNYTEISGFYILKFIELSLLIIYIYFNLRNKNRLIPALFVISFTGFFQGLIAIYQFVYQCPLFKSPLLHKLTGESTVYPQLPGIAKIIVDNEKLVRSYGTFPHPNILGGFLIVSILISVYLLLKHKDYILSSISTKFNLFYNINNTKSQGYISSVFWIILIFTQITALFFTFSRTAWFGFLLSLFIISIFYFYNHKIVSRETISLSKTIKNKIKIVDLIKVKISSCLLSQSRILGIRNDGVRKNVWDPVYLTFVKIIRKILSIKISWIPASAGMTKMEGILSKLKNKLKNNKNSKIVSRETISARDKINCYHLFYHFKELTIIIFFTIILIITYSSHINSRISENLMINKNDIYSSPDYLPSNYALNDRSFYNNVSRETISGNFLFGSGPGTFIFQIDSYLAENKISQELESWQYQPAHNIYLLIASEIGIIGLFLFLLFLSQIISSSFKTIKKPLNKRLFLNNISIVSRETITKINNDIKTQNIILKYTSWCTDQKNSLLSKIKRFLHFATAPVEMTNSNVSPVCRTGRHETILNTRKLNYFLIAILLSFLFIGLFDHYLWTLQQGRLMLWLVLGLILVNSGIMLKEDK